MAQEQEKAHEPAANQKARIRWRIWNGRILKNLIGMVPV